MGERRRRRSLSPEFKAEASRGVRESGKSVSTVARELDLTETALRRWVVQAELDAGRSGSGALTTDERAELTQLRRDVKTLRMERDILKKRRPSSPRSRDEVRLHRAREGHVPDRPALHGARGQSRRVLCGTTTSGAGAATRGSTARCARRRRPCGQSRALREDRKSTRLNSS